MANELSNSVSFGLNLSQRIYYGKESALSAPKPPPAMDRSGNYLPTAPMAYAVITEPVIVDNPDVASYQPYDYGRCEPPGLIPLHMVGVEMAVDCFLDTAFVTVCATWRVHCVAGNKGCEVRVAVPMGEQGSILGLEVEGEGRSCQIELITLEDTKDSEKIAKGKDGFLLKRRIFTLKVLKVEGGSNISMRVRWSQKLQYEDGKFCLNVPFSFPSYINPVGRKFKKREKMFLYVNPGTGTEILCKTCSHPLKEVKRQVGKLGFLYESEVSAWSSTDLFFSYEVSTGQLRGGLVLQPPSVHDIDRRDIFCLYFFPDNRQNRKVFRKEVVFIVDVSGSMHGGGALENCRIALLAALSKLNSEDLFNIIAFNADIQLFSPSWELATNKAIDCATQWISKNFIAEGGTNILLPMTKALEILAKTSSSVPLIFLITDGAVEDERHICSVVKSGLANRRSISPRIFTFGIGPYCNHYFLQMLAEIGRGYYDAAYEMDVINFRLQRLFDTALSIEIANINVDAFDNLDSLELYPNHIPDLSSASPLIVFGRCSRNFPESCKARGLLPDMSTFSLDLKVDKSTDIPLCRVSAKKQIDILTTHAWYSQSKQSEDKVAKMSMQTGVPSEYTPMILAQVDTEEVAKPATVKENIIFLRNLGIGFGNVVATSENLDPFLELEKLHESSKIIPKAAGRCCRKMMDCCCCVCFIRTCSYANDQCAVTLTQLFTALAICECINFCVKVCSCDC